MSEMILSQLRALPAPKTPMTVRVATREDMPFMDRLQKLHSKALGFFPRAQMEGYVDGGHVLVAETSSPRSHGDTEGAEEKSLLSVPPCLRGEKVGFVVSKDRYLKRDELGAIFQMCVAPGHERKFIAANLLREVFERSSYGCRLYCCWCAQDLAANKFWEAMGFVPIAFRAGGRGQRSEVRGQKSPRVHIFWQKRIRSGDTTTPYWFPAKTEGGAIREDRIVLPIPPGMRWWDELPVLQTGEQTEARKTLPSATMRRDEEIAKGWVTTEEASNRQSPRLAIQPRRKEKRSFKVVLKGETRFARAETPAVQSCAAGAIIAPARQDAPRNAKRRTAQRCDADLVRKARELRDRWMDHVNANGIEHAGAEGQVLRHGKYDVAKAIETGEAPFAPNRLAA